MPVNKRTKNSIRVSLKDFTRVLNGPDSCKGRLHSYLKLKQSLNMYIIYIHHTVPDEATSHKINVQKSHIILSFTIYCPFLNANKHEKQIDLQLYRLWFLAHTEYIITWHLHWSGFSVLRSFPSQTGVTYYTQT